MKEGCLDNSGEKQVDEAPAGVSVLRTERYNGVFKRTFKFSTSMPIESKRSFGRQVTQVGKSTSSKNRNKRF